MLNDSEKIAILMRSNYLGWPIVFYVPAATVLDIPTTRRTINKTENRTLMVTIKFSICITDSSVRLLFFLRSLRLKQFGAMRHQLLYCHETMRGTYFNDSAF